MKILITGGAGFVGLSGPGPRISERDDGGGVGRVELHGALEAGCGLGPALRIEVQLAQREVAHRRIGKLGHQLLELGFAVAHCRRLY